MFLTNHWFHRYFDHEGSSDGIQPEKPGKWLENRFDRHAKTIFGIAGLLALAMAIILAFNGSAAIWFVPCALFAAAMFCAIFELEQVFYILMCAMFGSILTIGILNVTLFAQ